MERHTHSVCKIEAARSKKAFKHKQQHNFSLPPRLHHHHTPNTQHQHQLPTMSADRDDVSDSDEEEEECRVCRGPAEEG